MLRPLQLPSIIGALLMLCGICSASQVIPFEYRDGLIWIKVNTPQSEVPLNFVLDSGAGSSVLDLATARKLNVKLKVRERVQCVDAAMSAWRVDGFSANVGGVAIRDNPLSLDLSETSELCSRRIDGLLGHDFFRDRIVQIDFKARCIRLLYEADDRNSCAVVSMKVRRGAMCVPVSVNGHPPRWTRLDTGCDDGLRWVQRGGHGYVRASLQVGQEDISNVQIALHHTEIFPSEAGLLGNGVLANYRVTIDAVKKRLLLEKS